jgi:hypothetical protein
VFLGKEWCDMSKLTPNLYWPVYQNLERAVEQLTFAIHFDDDQLSVYSSEIIDLILRAAAEVESIAKDLYRLNGGPETDPKKIYFDTMAMTYLDDLWNLQPKVVVLSSPNMFQSERELTPLHHNATGKFGPTWTWNQAYQALKHNRAESMSEGTIGNLVEIMAALYVLNLHYRNEVYELEKDSQGASLPSGLGSVLFSPRFHRVSSHGVDGTPNYGPDVGECLYLIGHTADTHASFAEALSAIADKEREFRLQHPQVLAALTDVVNRGLNEPAELAEAIRGALTTDEQSKLMGQAVRASGMDAAVKQLQWEAVPNRLGVVA